uniref:Uncharacterized protein n=1 Tax=Rhizophora mucronata TaxID=61149 RepID=A0A2P2PUQ7_RHIMU
MLARVSILAMYLQALDGQGSAMSAFKIKVQSYIPRITVLHLTMDINTRHHITIPLQLMP